MFNTGLIDKQKFSFDILEIWEEPANESFRNYDGND